MSCCYDRQEMMMMNGIDMGTVSVQLGAPLALPIVAGTKTPSGWPAAVTVRPDNWNMKLQPATYRIAVGDTLAGLAATYLGSPARWKEIWDLQPGQFRVSNSPDKIFPGQVFLMPDEARDNLKAWQGLGKPTAKKPGALSKTEKKKGAAIGGVKKYLPYAAGAAVGLAVLYAFSRR